MEVHKRFPSRILGGLTIIVEALRRDSLRLISPDLATHTRWTYHGLDVLLDGSLLLFIGYVPGHLGEDRPGLSRTFDVVLIPSIIVHYAHVMIVTGVETEAELGAKASDVVGSRE